MPPQNGGFTGNSMNEKKSYEYFSQRFKQLDNARKDIEAQTYAFRDEFFKVFIPDQKEFDDLKDQAKLYHQQKQSQEMIDKVYLKMAHIYKKWLPIEDQLYQMNPLYRDLFKGLKHILTDIEKKEGKNESRKKKNIDSEKRSLPFTF